MLLEARLPSLGALLLLLLPHLRLAWCQRTSLKVAVEPDLFDREFPPLRSLILDFERDHNVIVDFVYDNVKDTITDIEKDYAMESISAGHIDVVTVDLIYTWQLQDYLLPIDVSNFHFEEPLKRGTLEPFQAKGGMQMAMPMYESNAVMFYRSDLLREYNFSEPGPEGWTWDEVVHIARTVKKGESAKRDDISVDGFLWGGMDYEGLTCFASEVLADKGVHDWITDTGEVILATDPRVKEALEYMASWVTPPSDNETAISPARIYTAEESFVKLRFCQEGRAMFARGWPGMTRFCNSRGMAGKYGIVRNPGFVRGEGHGTAGSEGLAIARNSRKPDIALKFIEMVLSMPWQSVWARERNVRPVLATLASDHSRCAGWQRPSCRVALQELVPPGTEVRFPDGRENDTVIITAPSPLCPPYEHLATVCDVSFTNYTVVRPSRVARDKYEQVSVAFYEAVWSILYNDIPIEDMGPVLQAAACAMMSATKGAEVELWAPSCPVFCPEGEYADADGVCKTCGIFSTRPDCETRIPYAGALAAAILLIIFVNFYLLRMRAWADSVWAVNLCELDFGMPPEVLGRGTFGFVLRAECRGTEVAVKRVMAPTGFEPFAAFGPMPDVVPAADCERRSMRRSTRHTTTTAGSTVRKVRTSWSLPWGGDSPTDAADLECGGVAAARSTRSRSNSAAGASTHVSSWAPSEAYRQPNTHWPVVGVSQLRVEFIQEMRNLSKLRHPCVLTVMGAVISKRTEPMLVTELMQHGSLRDVLQNETVDVEGELVLPILTDIASGLRFLHASEVVHGDLRSQHVLVDSAFRAKISGFGFSQKERLGLASSRVPWMAPELIIDDEAPKSPSTDVYAFGVILIEVYTRADPFPGMSTHDIIAAVKDPMHDRRPEIPEKCSPEVSALMGDCFQADASLRPDAGEVHRRLQAMDATEAGKGITFAHRAKKRRRTWQLMCDVFPRHVAEALREGRRVEPDRRDAVTIFFSDIVGFTDISATLEPDKVSDMLDRLYSKFDALSHELHVFKVETIGDAYMAVSNLVEDQSNDHAKRIALFAQRAIRAANETLIDADDPSKGHVNIRVGFHSGPVVANVVGTRNLRYCLFGDTVNTAARMESNSAENRIHCSEAAADLVMKQAPEITIRSRGIISVKGKGAMHTFWVDSDIATS